MKKITVNSGRGDAQFDIDKVESKYNARFVGQFCLKTVDGGWSESPADVYYAPNPDKSQGHSHYFGLIIQHGQLYITRGDSGVESDISAAVADDGEIIYSRYRHDYRTSADGSTFIDGGRDYTHCGVGRYITIRVVDGEFYEVDTENAA